MIENRRLKKKVRIVKDFFSVEEDTLILFPMIQHKKKSWQKQRKAYNAKIIPILFKKTGINRSSITPIAENPNKIKFENIKKRFTG